MIPNPLLKILSSTIRWHVIRRWRRYRVGENTRRIPLAKRNRFSGAAYWRWAERSYNIGYQRQPQVLLVCDAGNAMVRMIEAGTGAEIPAD